MPVYLFERVYVGASLQFCKEAQPITEVNPSVHSNPLVALMDMDSAEWDSKPMHEKMADEDRWRKLLEIAARHGLLELPNLQNNAGRGLPPIFWALTHVGISFRTGLPFLVPLMVEAGAQVDVSIRDMLKSVHLVDVAYAHGSPHLALLIAKSGKRPQPSKDYLLAREFFHGSKMHPMGIFDIDGYVEQNRREYGKRRVAPLVPELLSLIEHTDTMDRGMRQAISRRFLQIAVQDPTEKLEVKLEDLVRAIAYGLPNFAMDLCWLMRDQLAGSNGLLCNAVYFTGSLPLIGVLASLGVDVAYADKQGNNAIKYARIRRFHVALRKLGRFELDFTSIGMKNANQTLPDDALLGELLALGIPDSQLTQQEATFLATYFRKDYTPVTVKGFDRLNAGWVYDESKYDKMRQQSPKEFERITHQEKFAT